MTYTSSTRTLQWNFLAPSSVNVLQPGECINSNRALADGEPRCLVQRNTDVFAVFPLSNLAGSRASSNQAAWVNSFMGFSPVRTFGVRRPASGCWEVL